MKKNAGETRRHIRGLGIVRLPRVVLLVMTLVVSAGIPLAIPGTASAQQPTNVLFAGDVAVDNVDVPPTTTSVQATAVQNGYRSWFSTIGNYTQAPVSNATVSIMSGYDPSLFEGVTSFPVTGTIASIDPGQGWFGPSLNPAQNPYQTLPVTYSLGYDSTRTVSPSVIPAGGGQQTVTIALTPVDARYGPAPNRTVNFNIFISSPLPGVTVASFTNPSNLDQGETLQTGSNSFAIFHWGLGAPVLGKQYTFTATLNVPNPSGVPFDYRPLVQFAGDLLTTICDGCTGSTVTVKDPTLDGNVPGSGAMTFSVAETNDTWISQHGDSFFVFYDGTTQVTPVTIAVKPGGKPPAPVNPRSQGVIPVAILSTSSFDATTVDPATARFGMLGTEASSTQNSLEDVNGDGKLDMVLHFPTQQTGISCGTTTVTLTGQTTSGQPISGTAQIKTVGCLRPLIHDVLVSHQVRGSAQVRRGSLRSGRAGTGSSSGRAGSPGPGERSWPRRGWRARRA